MQLPIASAQRFPPLGSATPGQLAAHCLRRPPTRIRQQPAARSLPNAARCSCGRSRRRPARRWASSAPRTDREEPMRCLPPAIRTGSSAHACLDGALVHWYPAYSLRCKACQTQGLRCCAEGGGFGAGAPAEAAVAAHLAQPDQRPRRLGKCVGRRCELDVCYEVLGPQIMATATCKAAASPLRGLCSGSKSLLRY